MSPKGTGTPYIRKCGRRMCRACTNARRNRQRTAA